MKIPFRFWKILLLLGLLLVGTAVFNLKVLYEDYKISKIDFGYVVESSQNAGQTCNRIAVYKGEELAGENTTCGETQPAFQPGEMIKVIWKQDQPTTAKIYTLDLYWADNLEMLAWGVNLMIAAGLFGWNSSKKKIPEELLGPKANTVSLTVFGIQKSKSLMPGLGNGIAIFARYDPMDDAFTLFPQSGKNVQPKDQLRIFKFVVQDKTKNRSKEGIPRPLPGKGSIIRAKLDLNNSHGQAYWPDHECVSEA